MKRPERTIIALDHRDAQRYARHLKASGDLLLCFEEAWTWSTVLRLLKQGTDTLIVLGARPPDKAAVRYLGPYSKQVVILQHAVNPRRKLKELSLGYFRSNIRKLLYWSIFSILCFLLPRRAPSPVYVYHFTLEYRDEWVDTLARGTISYTACPRPDPTSFGTIDDIPISVVPVVWLLIDEPFTQTLGISRAQERSLLQTILDETVQADDSPIMVKLHPRSKQDKYNFSDRFITGQILYSNANTVIGYRSGLLDYQFSTKRRLFIRAKDTGFRLELCTLESNNGKCETYLDFVQRYLADQGH